MKIFYLGTEAPGTTSAHRAGALRRLGHEVDALDLRVALGPALQGLILPRVHYRTGFRLIQSQVLALIQSNAQHISRSDMVWVDGGELLGSKSAALLSTLAPTVLVCTDDPTGGRDGRRFDSLVSAIPNYDLIVTFREPTLQDFRRLGARRAMRVWFSYDEITHRPPSEREMEAWGHRGSIAFIGTWMRGEDRDKILLGLINRGLPISIWGSSWRKSPLWSRLQPAWKGEALYGRDYCRAIAGSAACIGFLSQGNRDLHTTRSMEIPFAGGLFLGMRTTEHSSLYEEDREAYFWDTPAECAEKCATILSNRHESDVVRGAGMRRVRQNRCGNESLVQSVLDELYKSRPRAAI